MNVYTLHYVDLNSLGLSAEHEDQVSAHLEAANGSYHSICPIEDLWEPTEELKEAWVSLETALQEAATCSGVPREELYLYISW